MKKYLLYCLLVYPFAAAYAADAMQTLSFYKQQTDALVTVSNRDDRAYANALADGLDTWVAQYADNVNVPQAMATEARLYLLAQERARALITLLSLSKNYPQTDLAPYQSMVTDALQAVNEPYRTSVAAKAFTTTLSEKATAADRKAAVLFTLSKLQGRTLYAPSAAAFEQFFRQYPAYEKNDQVELWYGDLHRMNNNYLAAISQYQKATSLYPNTPYRAASLRLIGDIYADNLKDTPHAMAMYTQVLRDYPNSNETGIVYKHMAILEENNKNYDNALINYDKAIAVLGTSDNAYEAYRGKADVYKKTKNYNAAYNALLKTAQAFSKNEEKYTESLWDAATLAQKKLKDQNKYTQALERALVTYPKNPKSAEIMYNLALTYEQQNRKVQAQEMYKKLILSFPSDKYANKAQGRLKKLETK
jgi:tetratricopeptide (TPR) repeat protein